MEPGEISGRAHEVSQLNENWKWYDKVGNKKCFRVPGVNGTMVGNETGEVGRGPDHDGPVDVKCQFEVYPETTSAWKMDRTLFPKKPGYEKKQLLDTVRSCF